MDALNKFSNHQLKHGTHMDRHISIMERQANVFQEYLRLCQSHPVNSQEFESKINFLHDRLIDLVEEMKELTDLFVQDCDDFQDVLETMKAEVLHGEE